jgi:hypothetical protein
MNSERVIYDSKIVCDKAYVVPDYTLNSVIALLNDHESYISSCLIRSLVSCKEEK